MKHLTDEQLSALLDGALAGAERAAAEAHLPDCEACRARLAETGALDASLERSLAHDPGEAYFESFADRVAARIAASGARPEGASAPAPPRRSSPWTWLLSPRGLALAGSTAALALVAGLAWVRLHERGDTLAELRAPEPSPSGSTLAEPAAPEASSREAAPQADAVAPAPVTSAPSPSESAQPEAAPGQGPARMQRARRIEPGAAAPLTAPAPPAPSRDASTSTIGRMKQGARPATGDVAPPAATAPQSFAAPPAAATRRAPTPTANEAPAAKAAAPAPSQATSRGEEETGTRASAQALAPCGTVRDSRGRAVSGAQVMVVNDVTRTARTAPDGSFCLPRLEAGDVLSVLRVGYEPVRITVAGDTPLAVVMEPVGTLGPDSKQALTSPGSPSSKGEGSSIMSPRPLISPPPPPDVYAKQSAEVRERVEVAREVTRAASREHTAARLDSATVRWDAVAALATGAALHDARFQALSLRRQALSLEPTSERLDRLREGLRVYLAQAPRGSREYAIAQRWQSELSGGNKSLYR